ncbi:virulence factor SrfB [Cohaesibacter celericrescens]|uniref:Virulence protein SrfB n=1 Tax=Cohaesibacter celericrescens TaxID=2067669 RepID=A0A2N5XUP8_9HYPH|nr:virulence factor SrfB [Cohaesibacter celericrescens]PLW78200.1 virulence protein SrfB [Cohaesibacter celericrescens]
MTIFADITLVPFSGIQFVSNSFDINRLNAFRLHFIERPYPDEATEEGVPWKLLQGWNEEDANEDPPNVEQGDDLGYDINKMGALEPFIGKWVPVPYLRRLPGRGVDSEHNFDKGPTNWARAMVVRDTDRSSEDGLWYKVVFAFDTALAMEEDESEQAAGDMSRPDQQYVAPRKLDVENPCEFRFVSSMDKIGWFLSNPQLIEGDDEPQDFQIWVAEWLEELFDEYHDKKSKGRKKEKEYHLEHAARWIALIQLLEKTIQPGIVRFVDTISENRSIRPVEVDLVLDVGNSRTCGMLIENYPNEDSVELNNSLILQLRDLQQPWKLYNEPFESHVALSQAWFGKENLSRLSGRSDAFFWPTMVRVGPEASRIKSTQSGAESIISMSAPKRYLWDVAPVNQPWRFPQSDYTDEGDMPPVGRVSRRYLNAHGDVLSQVRKDKDLFAALYPRERVADYNRPSQQLSYSRSSFYGFMLAEIFFQAMVMINDPAVRAERRQSEAPRSLRRIILTLPTALPVREQRIMKARAESAISFLWDIMKWSENPPPGVVRPSVHVSWDEASCVQFVWLYGEISRRFGGHIKEYFDMSGKPRPRFETDELPEPDAVPEPSLRVASLDIGGGTTDLMITTFFQDDDRAIVPVQTFREGVRIAGDDITKAIIERCLIPVLEKALTDYGVKEARIRLRDLFNGDRANMAEHQKHARRQYVQQVLVPAALGIMERYEDSGEDRYEVIHAASMAELIRDSLHVSPSVLHYLLSDFDQDPEAPFDIMSMMVPLDFKLVADAVHETLDVVFDPISEALSHFDCDYVLLSGRPTKLAAVQESLLNRLFIGPDRLLPMGKYRAGNWYPFRSRDNTQIGDPKSCAVVGGVLCAMAERSIANFMLYTHMLQARSTTRYIGELEKDMKLLNDNVLFTFDDLASNGTATEQTLKLYTEGLIGYRQLPYERWVTSPLYHLRLEDSKPPRPIEITLTRDQVEELEDEERPDEQAVKLMKHEATKEDLRISDAIDAIGGDVSRSVSISFRTFPLAQGDYWLDSGILSI